MLGVGSPWHLLVPGRISDQQRQKVFFVETFRQRGYACLAAGRAALADSWHTFVGDVTAADNRRHRPHSVFVRLGARAKELTADTLAPAARAVAS